MIAQDVISHEAVTFDDLKPLATASGPCITMTVPLPNPAEIDVRLKNAIRGVQNKLAEFGTDDKHSASLMAPIREFAITAETDRVWGHAIVLLRSPDLFRYYMLRGPVQELQTVAEHFQVRPLLAAMTHEMRFHLLGLSRRHVRLYHCTQFRAEQAAAHLPQNLDAWLNTRQPDHVLDNRSTAGPSSGKTRGIIFGTSTDRDRDHEYVAHFLAAVEKGVTAHLHNDPAPLVLAGVEYELAIYRRFEQLRADAGAVSPGLTRPHNGPGPARTGHASGTAIPFRAVTTSPGGHSHSRRHQPRRNRCAHRHPGRPAGPRAGFSDRRKCRELGDLECRDTGRRQQQQAGRASECRGPANPAPRRPGIRCEGVGHARTG